MKMKEEEEKVVKIVCQKQNLHVEHFDMHVNRQTHSSRFEIRHVCLQQIQKKITINSIILHHIV